MECLIPGAGQNALFNVSIKTCVFYCFTLLELSFFWASDDCNGECVAVLVPG